MRVRRPQVVLIVGALGFLGLLGCAGSAPPDNGEAAKSGPQVVQDAVAALARTKGFHLTIAFTDAKRNATGVDIQVQPDGTSGVITQQGVSTEMILVGDATYLRAPAALYERDGKSPAEAAKLANRWYKSPSDFQTFTLSGLLNEFRRPPVPGAVVSDKVTTGRIGDRDVVIASQSDGSKLYVAARGEPLPLKVENPATSKNGPGTWTFTDYGRRETIVAPDDAIDRTGFTT
jgi:hypothetical protein